MVADRPKLRHALPALFLVLPLAAQSTGTPVYQAPYRAFSRSEVGISFSDPGAGYALEGSYRVGLGSHVDGGVRGHGASNSLLLGFDARARVLDHSESFPLDGSFTFGFGIDSRSHSTVGLIPLGFSMGRRVLVENSATSLVAYVQPTITPLFMDGEGTEYSIGFGVDLRVNPRLDLRFSGGIGDNDGIGFTVAFLH
jgi:hypothetical protein